MDHTSIHSLRVPVLIAGLLGFCASVACGSEAPEEKTGGGLGSAGGKAGSGTGAVVGKGGGISVTGGTSASGGSVAAGGSSGSIGTGATGDGSLDGGNACAVTSGQGDKEEVALLFMVDISGSMLCPLASETPPCTSKPDKVTDQNRWSVMRPALDAFFASMDSDGMWAGISFFSRHSSCDAKDYVTPDAEIALLPGGASEISKAVDAQKPDGATPTVAALQGALTHADAWATAHLDQQVVVVYATDGYPLGCSDPNNTIANAASIAKTAYDGKNAIRTYVIGVGPNLDDLNQIASSGGTDQAMLLDTTKDFTAELAARLAEIRSAVAVDCVYNVPAAPAGQNFDGRVNVNYTSGAGAVEQIGYNSATDCQEGWQYVDATDKQIKLCGTSCDTVKADAKAKIDVLYGCSTVNVGGVR